jgi:uncharacterized phage-associated protein
MTDAQSLVKLLLRLAQRESIPIGKTKLVKLLYLMEVEYYRAHRERLTSLRWSFLYYGPYTSELESLLDSPDIEVIPERLRDGRIRETVTVSEPAPSYGITPELEQLAEFVMERWGGLGLEGLLDYVYFETEPMLDAERGQELDFTRIEPARSKTVRKVSLDRKKLAEIRKRVARHSVELGTVSAVPAWNPGLAEAIKIWDEDSYHVRVRGSVVVYRADLQRESE